MFGNDDWLPTRYVPWWDQGQQGEVTGASRDWANGSAPSLASCTGPFGDDVAWMGQRNEPTIRVNGYVPIDDCGVKIGSSEGLAGNVDRAGVLVGSDEVAIDVAGVMVGAEDELAGIHDVAGVRVGSDD